MLWRVIVGCGPLLAKAIEAGKKLGEQGVRATVINNPFINRVDVATIGGAVKAASGHSTNLVNLKRKAALTSYSDSARAAGARSQTSAKRALIACFIRFDGKGKILGSS